MESWQLLIIVVLALALPFGRKVWGVFDPLFLFLATRMATAITISGQYIFDPKLTGPATGHMVSSVLLCLGGLWVTSPRAEVPAAAAPVRVQERYLLRIALFLLFLKLSIMLSVLSSLPIVSGEHGSDSYIGFDEDHKVASSFLLGLGSVDTVLLACVLPLLTGAGRKALGRAALALSILLAVASLKKSAVLNVFLSLVLGDYLRAYFYGYRRRVFLRPGYIVAGVCVGVAWGVYVYRSTMSGYAATVLFENANDVLNFVPFQWIYVYSLYLSGVIYDFAATYDFNRYLYFFHSVLSPMGFPAFAASIGPSLHQFQTGTLSGNGVNPTFVVEGYVVFGPLLSLFYSLGVGCALGLGRRLLLRRPVRVARQVVLASLLLPPLYVLPVDSLLSIKQLVVCLVLLGGICAVDRFMRCLAVISAAVPADGAESPRDSAGAVA